MRLWWDQNSKGYTDASKVSGGKIPTVMCRQEVPHAYQRKPYTAVPMSIEGGEDLGIEALSQ
jgi:hypothetical protein